MTPVTTWGHSRRRAAVHVAVVALLLSACGGGSDDPATDDAVSTTADGSDAPDDRAADDRAADDQAAAPPAATEELTAAQGWNGNLHDLEVPGPGVGVLTVDGETIDLEVTCLDPPDLQPLILFTFQGRGDGVDAQGRAVYIEVERRIVSREEAATSVYDYDGQEYGSLQIVTATGDASAPFHSAITVSPSDADPAGSQLPIVRVEEGGSFTAVADAPPLSSIHDQALHGATEFAGTCPA